MARTSFWSTVVLGWASTRVCLSNPAVPAEVSLLTQLEWPLTFGMLRRLGIPN